MLWAGKQAQIQSRRAALLARSLGLRRRLAQQAQVLERPLAMADRARGRLQWLWAHPQWLAAAVAVPLALRPRRALAWGLKLWGGWRLWRQLRQIMRGA